MVHLSDGPDYDYGPYDDEYRGFERADDDGGRGPIILCLALGVLIIFAGVIWNTYRQGIRPAGSALPVIAGPEQPYKHLAEVAGGEVVPDTDKGYYGLMEGESERAAVEQAEIKNRPNIRRNTELLAGGPETVPPVSARPVTSDPIKIENATVEGLDPRKPDVVESGTVKTAALNNSSPLKLTPPLETGVQPRLDIADPMRTADSRFLNSGAFEIQLAALRSEASARSAWSAVLTDHSDLFSGAKLNIQRADLGARGVFYRLRIGQFETRAKATSFCSEYKAVGGDCIVVSAK
ncbi:MAG: SPOR domain-containing protein [Pseudomonadota bacterium]